MINKNSNRFWILGCLFIFFWGCVASEVDNSSIGNDQTNPYELELKLQQVISVKIDTTEHFRGVAVSGDQAFIAGSKGSIVTLNLKSRSIDKIYSLEGKHFRDVDILPNGDLVAMAITEPAEIWKKSVMDDSFRLVFSSLDSVAFFDGIDFWDDSKGLLFGDALNGFPYVLYTEDGGETWTRIPQNCFPSNVGDISGFAASGTSIQCLNKGSAIIGLGGESAVFLKTNDYGKSWKMIMPSFMQAQEGVGVYSIAMKDELNGIAVGGFWEEPECDSSKIYTFDGGENWTLAEGVQEYRSCVTYIKDNIYVSTGTNGTDISYDGGKSWTVLDSIGFNSIAINDNGQGIAVGNWGRIFTFVIQ